MSPPSSGSKNKPSKNPVPLVSRYSHAWFILRSLKMEATCYSVTSVDFQRTTRRYIQKDRTPQNQNTPFYMILKQMDLRSSST
jgi:hypothetical protein